MIEALKEVLKKIVLKWALPKGLEWCESAISEKKPEIDAKIAELVPGTIADEAVCAVVESIIHEAIAIAKKYLVSVEGASVAGTDAEVEAALKLQA